MNIEKLKSIIEKTAKKLNVPHQNIYDMYFFERFLYRLSKSQYKDKFVFKGGFLLEKIVGLNQRTTLDIDLKAIKVEMTDEEINTIFTDICNIKTDDEIEYSVTGVEDITAESKYNGKSVRILAKLKNLKRQFGIDIAKGDIVTPYPQKFLYKSDIDENSFDLLAYTTESIIAEKFETMIAKGTSNSRSKDLFDMYLLMKENVDIDKLNSALINTFCIRNTPFNKQNILEEIEKIFQSQYKRDIFNQYVKTHIFASDVSFEDAIESARKIATLIQVDDTILPNVNIHLTLVRHGEDEQNKVGGWSNNILTKTGIKQVKDYDVILSSDLERAKETTEIIRGVLNCDVIYEKNLREINNGVFQNMTIKEFMKSSEKIYFADLKFDDKYPGGESPKDFYLRTKICFLDILNKYKDKKVLVVTHGGNLMIINCILNHYKYSSMLKVYPDYAKKIEVILCKND